LLATTEVEGVWDLVFDSETIRAGLVEVEVEVEGVLLAGTAGLAIETGVEEEGERVFFEDTREGEIEVEVEAEEGIAATRRVEEAVARA
jgi:hypothetical protein